MKSSFLRVLFVVLFVCGAITVSAQKQTEGKSSVFIDYFAHPSNVKDSWAEALRSKVIEGIQETNRVLITDVDAEDALRVEKARRENGELSAAGDASRLAVMTQLGANYLLQGTITSLSVDHKRSDDGKSEWYAAVVNYTLKVVDPKNGTTIASKTFKHGESITEMATGDTPDAAAVDVAKFARKAVRALVDEAFKLNGTILEINATKGDEAKQVYISLGSAHGVGSKARFKVYELRTVAGRNSRKEIGELKVSAVEGEDLTLCDVVKGGKEIKAAMDAQQKIEVEVFHKVSLLDKAKGLI